MGERHIFLRWKFSHDDSEHRVGWWRFDLGWLFEPMRFFAYFAGPTIAGWVAGSFTCAASMSVRGGGLLSFRDICNLALVAGLFIVAPTFFLFILPYCGLALHALRTSKIRRASRFYVWPLFLGLLAFGIIITFALAHAPPNLFLPPENPMLSFLPFIPYAAVVAFLSRRLFRFIQNHDT